MWGNNKNNEEEELTTTEAESNTMSDETKKPKTIEELIESKGEQIKEKKDYIKGQQKLLRKFNTQKEMLEFRKWKDDNE
jgi:hypothetical protein